MITFKLLAAVIAAFTWLAAIPAAPAACPVPVFEYALENWDADPYEIHLVHRGEIGGEAAETLDFFERTGMRSPDLPANLEITTIDLDTEAGKRRGAELEKKAPSLPWMFVYYPSLPGRGGQLLWSGEPEMETARALLDSPVRRELAEKLLQGKTAVWLLLEGDSRRNNRSALATLEDELKRLERTLRLPDLAEWGVEPIERGKEGAPEVSFPIMRVNRSDPREKMLVKMLLGSERDLGDFAPDTPMVFPVFGRGLALYALVGNGINAFTINDAADFLIGPCSCVIKASNPGTDLILQADWSQRKPSPIREIAPPGIGINEFFQRMDEAGEITEEMKIDTPAERGN